MVNGDILIYVNSLCISIGYDRLFKYKKRREFLDCYWKRVYLFNKYFFDWIYFYSGLGSELSMGRILKNFY